MRRNCTHAERAQVWLKRRNHRHDPSGGFTVIEMMFTIAILALVLGIISAAMFSAQTQVQRTSARSEGNDQVRLALDQIDTEIRSGNVFYNPNTFNYMGLVIYTQAQANTLGQRCVQWQIANGQLQTRWWAPYWTSGDPFSPWQTVATDVVNQTLGVHAFTLDPNPAYGNRLLDVDILTQPANTAAHPTETRASISGRDTQYGYPQTVCQAIPSD